MGMLRDHFQKIRDHRCSTKEIVTIDPAELVSFKCVGCGEIWKIDEEQIGEMLVNFDQRDDVINSLLASVEGKRQLLEMINV